MLWFSLSPSDSKHLQDSMTPLSIQVDYFPSRQIFHFFKNQWFSLVSEGRQSFSGLQDSPLYPCRLFPSCYFFLLVWIAGIHWSLSDSKFHQDSRTLRSILIQQCRDLDIHNCPSDFDFTHSGLDFSHSFFRLLRGLLILISLSVSLSVTNFIFDNFFSSLNFTQQYPIHLPKQYSSHFTPHVLIRFFYLRLSDSKFPQVSRIHLSVLTDFWSTFVGMVLPHFFNSSSLISRICGTIPSFPKATNITVTLISLRFLSCLASSGYLTSFRLFHL